MIKLSSVQVGSKVVLPNGEKGVISAIRKETTGKRGRPSIFYTVGDKEYKGTSLSLDTPDAPVVLACRTEKPRDMPVQAYDYIKHMHPRLLNGLR